MPLFVTDVQITENIFKAKFRVEASITPSQYVMASIETSDKYALKDANFQIRVLTTVFRDSDRKFQKIKNHIFAEFSKHQNESQVIMILTSTDLFGCNTKKRISDSGNWTLIHENEKFHSFELQVRFEVVKSEINYFSNLYSDEELTDFELCGIDGSVKVHRCVLAASSPVLYRMLAGQWSEAVQGHVDIPNVSAVTLNNLKEYIYLHKLPDTGIEDLLLLASQYIMTEMEEDCVNKMMDTISGENFVDILEFAVLHKINSLLKAILEFVECGVVKVNDLRDLQGRARIIEKLDLEANEKNESI